MIEIKLKPKHIMIFLIIAFPCGIIDSCMEGSRAGFFIGILSGIVATLTLPLFVEWYWQRFGGSFSIYKLSSWYKFVMIFSTCFLMITFNFLWMSDLYGIMTFSAESSKRHVVIISVVSVVIAICILLITLFIQHLIFNYYLEKMCSELETSVGSSTATAVVLVVNWLASLVLKIIQANDTELGADIFFIYQTCILVVLFVSIVLLLKSRVLYEGKVKEVNYSAGTLPLFLLQGKDSLLCKDGKISLKDLDGISITLNDGTNSQYHCKFISNVFLWSRDDN